MRVLRLWIVPVAVLALLAVFTQGGAARAQLQTFENDTDNYSPNGDPVNDPNLAGSPPVDGDWRDSRNGGDGFIEEVPKDYLGVKLSPSLGGENYGVVYPENFQGPPDYTQGPFGFPSASVQPLGQSWSYQVDIHTDGSVNSNNNGVADFWWTNSVYDNDGFGSDGSGYLTETGFTGEVLPNGEWRFTTTKGGEPGVDLSPNAWYTLEVSYEASSPQLGANLRIYNQAHTIELYNHSLSTLFNTTNPPQSDQLGGPRYSWFAYFEENLGHLSIDNVGVDAPISLVSSNISGDMNADGLFDSADLEEFQLALNNLSSATAVSAMGDVNGDGAIDNFDIDGFLVLGSNFPATGDSFVGGSEQLNAALVGSSVPEPSSLILLGLGALALLSRGVRRRIA